jgi:hypothetical protein
MRKVLVTGHGLLAGLSQVSCGPGVGGEECGIARRESAERWQCSRSSVDRIARRAGLTRLCLGKNGIVRYIGEEVIAYEQSRRVQIVA